jgi:hypothetical protein
VHPGARTGSNRPLPIDIAPGMNCFRSDRHRSDSNHRFSQKPENQDRNVCAVRLMASWLLNYIGMDFTVCSRPKRRKLAIARRAPGN